MSPVPADFAAEAEEAKSAGDAAKLTLLRLEVEGLPWQGEAEALLVANQSKQEAVDRVILFTGHRIDSADRKTPRFPPEDEPLARAAIQKVVARQISLAQGPILGVAGGANGGDILFLECCRDSSIHTEMLLALPPEQFIPASVESDTGNWVARFQALATSGLVKILAQSKTLPPWLSQKPNYDIWQRNNLWLIAYALAQRPRHFILAALWDGKGGDGPGGTQHMVNMAKEHGAQVIVLETHALFGVGE